MSKMTRFLIASLAIATAAPALADDDDDDDDGGGLRQQVEELRVQVESLQQRIGGEDLEVTVSCPAQSIDAALEAAPLRGRLVINVAGTCRENVTISRNDVVLRGTGPANSKIIGVPETDPILESPVSLQGAQRIEIENLTVAGGTSSGIAANASLFTLRDSLVAENGSSGVSLANGSVGRIERSTLRDNGQSGVVCIGAIVQVTDSTIQDNASSGVRALNACRAFVGQTFDGEPGGNIISGNAKGVAAVFSGYALVNNNTIEENSEDGVHGLRGGSVDLRNNIIRENGFYGLFLGEGSNGRLEAGNTIESSVPDFSGVAVAVFRNSVLRILGEGNRITTTVAPAPSPFPSCDSSAAGPLALSVAVNSSVLQDRGHATVVGNIESFNLSTLDLRDIDITGNLFLNGLGANGRLRDQGRVPGNVTVTGDICLFGPLIVRPTITVDGFVDCNGGFRPGGIDFASGGFRNCR